MRRAFAALLFGLAGAFVVFSAGVLSNVWGDYKDSPDSTYIEAAAIWLALAAVAAFAGIVVLRRG